MSTPAPTGSFAIYDGTDSLPASYFNVVPRPDTQVTAHHGIRTGDIPRWLLEHSVRGASSMFTKPDLTAWISVLESKPNFTTQPQDLTGLPDQVDGSGTLLSYDYPGLNPGWWVWYLGPFQSKDAATTACDQAGEVYLTL